MSIDYIYWSNYTIIGVRHRWPKTTMPDREVGRRLDNGGHAALCSRLYTLY